jgi:hypothetical protein
MPSSDVTVNKWSLCSARKAKLWSCFTAKPWQISQWSKSTVSSIQVATNSVNTHHWHTSSLNFVCDTFASVICGYHRMILFCRFEGNYVKKSSSIWFKYVCSLRMSDIQHVTPSISKFRPSRIYQMRSFLLLHLILFLFIGQQLSQEEKAVLVDVIVWLWPELTLDVTLQKKCLLTYLFMLNGQNCTEHYCTVLHTWWTL